MTSQIYISILFSLVILNSIAPSQSAPCVPTFCPFFWWCPEQGQLQFFIHQRQPPVMNPPNASQKVNSFGIYPSTNPDDPPPTQEPLFPPTRRPPGVSSQVTLFGFNNRRGNAQKFDVKKDECVTLPKPWRERVLSVNTHGTCVQLCEKQNCRGRCVKVKPGSVSHNRLRDIDFDKRTSSLKSC